MRLSEICIQRPVFATVLSLVIVLIGAVSYTRLSVREYPRIDTPVVTVETRYLGASAEVIETQITKPLEDSLAGIDSIDVITSISRAEQSQITVTFRLEKDADSAAADVRDRVSRVRAKLPKSVDEPVIAKVEADANPIIWLSFSSPTRSALEVSDIANRVVKPRLQVLPGAADVRINGERKYAMRIWIDRDRLAAYGLTPAEVESAIGQQNVELPAGRVESQQREFTVTARTDLNRPEEFGAIIIKQVRGYPVRLRDVGRVEVDAASVRSSVRFNGESAVAIGVIRQATANPLTLAEAVRESVPVLNAELASEGVQVNVSYDSTVFIDRSIEAVFKTIVEAIILVAVVIFFFLHSARASVIPLVTIPVSLIGTFALMLIAGFSINTLTLLALVLAIGLVVDDAIVVLENIFRHIEEGMKPVEAAFQGIREIGFAVIAMTLTLAAVYAPVAFTTGRIGRLFVEFALTLAGAVIVSGFVALTLSPMMCSRLLRHEERRGPITSAIERFLDRLTENYRRLLQWTLRRGLLIGGVFTAVAVLCGVLFVNMKQELSPIEDRGVIFTVISGPDGASLEYTENYARRIESIGKTLPEVDRVFVVAGNPTVDQAVAFLRTVDWAERDRKTVEMIRQIQPRMASIPGVLAFPNAPPSLGQSIRDRPVSFVVTSSDSYDAMGRTVGLIVADVMKNPNFLGVDTDLRLNKPELSITVNRERAADMGVSVEAIGRAIETMMGGRQVTRFKRAGDQYDVIVQVEADARNTPDDINKIFVRNQANQMVPLSSLVRVQETIGPRQLNHFGQRRSITISANLAPGYTQGEALKLLEESAAKHLTAGYATDVSGSMREFVRASGSLGITFMLALLFIYLVLAAQFESFKDPIMIMLTVPLSMLGALAALQATGGTLNVYSQIGLITLVGLITKHGILIVEFTNQLREQGREMRDAVVEAAVLRLRPILMTTGAMVLGALPLALARGAGAESRSQIGWVIVGGMTLGTLLTLFVLPSVILFFDRLRRRRSHALGHA
ncbi:MAG: efflux RND transporter permease subunit [Betaproteobacteria bacterium]|jgi:multidrug efflux pump|nr:efflux RND transporter permease subunit [Betaproteobacteria bacterium]